MKKIKIVGMLIFLLSLSLAFLSNAINEKNLTNTHLLDAINEQKAFTQEISKNIFYIYKNKDASSTQLDASINDFIKNMNDKNNALTKISSIDIKKENEKIVLLWNQFYLSVQKFRDKSKVTTLYSNIVLEDIVKDIYTINLKLVVEFNRLIELHHKHFEMLHKNDKNLQYILFFLLIFLLIYLFTQVKTIIAFIQKFVTTSTNVMRTSSVKNLEYIEVEKNSDELAQAANNFNALIDKINKSIDFSSKSIENSYKSLEICENNIEELFEFLNQMQESEAIDNELTRKEDALILSLEELSSSALNLKNIKKDLNALISHKKL